MSNDKLPERIIVSNGCHDCPLFFYREDDDTESCKADESLLCSEAAIEEFQHPQCPLLTHTIKVVKS
jgi:hypothetical protein